ncbi:MAG TPA: DNA primase [Candidatus Hydrogenedentes bacterium]|nr:DNA primase [Candidatus Hydrogenedentota bacterium]
MMKDHTYGFRIVGPCSGVRRCVIAAAALNAHAECDERLNLGQEAYLSHFQFDGAFREHLNRTRSVKGFTGSCWASWIWFDIDAADDLAEALVRTRRLITTISDAFSFVENAMLVFFSGAKGFHVAIPTAAWKPEPSEDFNRIARRFCETVAEKAGIAIDCGIYDKVRPFRAPNTRHPKTGLHKRHIGFDGCMQMSIEAILKLAEAPESFELPPLDTTLCDWELGAAWRQAEEEVRKAARSRVEHPGQGQEQPEGLSRWTMEFIRRGAAEGERANRLFQAAANLAEYGCSDRLAHAILTEPALDSGLCPSEVRRQIDCGLERGRRG